MNVCEAILKRRCIRDYTDKKVSWNDLSEILDAGLRAPNAGNLQNWRFILIEKEETKIELAKISLNQMWMAKASHYIIVCSDETELKRYYPQRGEILYPIQNCACAIENMLLLATEKNIDTGWVGAFEDEAIRRILKIPDSINPQAILTFGYGQNLPKEPTRRFDLDKVLYFNEWGLKNADIGLFPLSKHGESLKAHCSLMSKLKGMFKQKDKEVAELKENNEINS
jgi:nitroreductase